MDDSSSATIGAMGSLSKSILGRSRMEAAAEASDVDGLAIASGRLDSDLALLIR